jgi:hypothetical protein
VGLDERYKEANVNEGIGVYELDVGLCYIDQDIGARVIRRVMHRQV